MKKTIKDHLRKGSISLGILMATGFAVALLVVNISFILFISNDMQIYSTLINDTGKVRGGSQRVIKNELMHVNNDANISTINQILKEIDQAQANISVKFEDAQEYGRNIEALISQWLLVSTEIKQYRANQISSTQLIESSEKLWHIADQAVGTVEQAAHFDVILYYIISVVSSITVLLLFAIILIIKILIRDRSEFDINHDPLTGLYNRYYLSKIVDQELIMANKPDMSVYVLLCDIDHFRAINDTYGYEMGDRVIKSMAQLLKQQTRHPDVAVRLSGETFILLIHEPNLQEALSYGRQLKDAVEQLQIREGLNLTLSIGVARYGKGTNWDEALKNADLALYEAKHTGRNAICTRESQT